LNFAENLLFPENVQVDEFSTAVIAATEIDGELVTATWAELRDAVRRCSNALRAVGVKPKNVVAGFVSNHVEALVAMLSAAAIGAIWTGISPDNGVSAVLDRLVQIEPKVLFADNGTIYNGKSWSSMGKTAQIVDELKSLELIVLIDNVPGAQPKSRGLVSKGSVVVIEYHRFLSR
jgi:acetoacetyl-CoA synthetase